MMKTCGNKAQTKIKFGFKTNLDKVIMQQHEWYCKDHINAHIKKHFTNGKVRVEFPDKGGQVFTQNLDAHIEQRKYDDYYEGAYINTYDVRDY